MFNESAVHAHQRKEVRSWQGKGKEGRGGEGRGREEKGREGKGKGSRNYLTPIWRWIFSGPHAAFFFNPKELLKSSPETQLCILSNK